MNNQTLPLEKELEPIFKKSLPSFPENIKDVIVQLAPWLSLLGAIIGVLTTITFLGASFFNSVFRLSSATFRDFGWSMWLGLFSLLAIIFLCATSYKPLQNGERKGWNNMYWLSLIMFCLNILGGHYLNGIISAFLGFWVLFQVRERYLK
jgi:hypothetical protein